MADLIKIPFLADPNETLRTVLGRVQFQNEFGNLLERFEVDEANNEVRLFVGAPEPAEDEEPSQPEGE